VQRFAEKVVDQFCTKIAVRHRSGEQPRDELKYTLACIARSHTLEVGLTHAIHAWVETAQKIGNRKPMALYLEAVGYGIVQQVADRRWQWAHAFVQRYLSAL
jgi:hypothetical protein